jgi:hypothetical protein
MQYTVTIFQKDFLLKRNKKKMKKSRGEERRSLSLSSSLCTNGESETPGGQ